MKFRIVCLILLTTVMSRSSSGAPRLSSPTVSGATVLQARLSGLEDMGAAEVMPAERLAAVHRAVGGVVDDASLGYAAEYLGEFEKAFDEIASREASAAREACIQLEWRMEEVEETVAGGEGCRGLPEKLAHLSDQLAEIRRLAYGIGRNAAVAMHVKDLVVDTQKATDDVIVAAAVCGTINVGPDIAEEMLAAAGRMTKGRAGLDSSVYLYANIIDGAPGTGAGEAALRRINVFGPDLQRALAATVRAAAVGCDTEVAHANLDELDGLMAALSERAPDLVDPSIRWRMPELGGLVKAMDARCAPGRSVQHRDPEPASSPESPDVSAIEDLLSAGHLDEAGTRIAALDDAEDQTRLMGVLDTQLNIAEAEELMRSGRVGEAVVVAENAWLRSLATGAGSVLAGCLSARAESALALGKPQVALFDVQRALIAAPKSNRARGVAAAVYARLGKRALASGNPDEAIRLFRASTRLRENGELRLEMAQLLAARLEIQEARLEVERAERLGQSIDPATRLQVVALGNLMSGETGAAWKELDTVAQWRGRSSEDLRIHLLRLPLSASLGRLAAGFAGAGGLTGGNAGVLAYVGANANTFRRGALIPDLPELPGSDWSGFIDDYRYMAFSDAAGNAVVFDARAGKAAEQVDGTLAEGNVSSLAALARAEVVEALAWFLVTPFENALNSDMLKGEQREAIHAALAAMVSAGLDYALLADSRGRATEVAGSIGEDHQTGLRIAAVSAPNTRPTTVDGRSYREVVAPVKVGKSVQAMLVLGVAIEDL